MSINFISSKDSVETRNLHTQKSNNIEIMIREIMTLLKNFFGL